MSETEYQQLVVCSSSEPAASSSQADVLEDQVGSQNECNSSSVTSESSDLGLCKDPTKEMCASIVAKLQESGVSSSLVSSIVRDMEELTSKICSQAKHNVISALPETELVYL